MKLNECILTDLGSVNRGKSKHRPRNDKSLFGGKYPFIQTGEVKSANFYLNTYSETYNDKGLAQSKLWEEGTLLITIAANIAETAILSIKACFPDSIIGFIPYENKSDVRFVKYYLDYIKKKLQVISQGTTQDNMSVEKLTSMKLFVPDYINQIKIANILSNYDNLIENNNKRIKLLENMAEELYKEWFVRLRFPNYQNTKIVDGIPDGWEYNKLSELSYITDGTHESPNESLEENTYFLITGKHLINNQIDFSNAYKISKEEHLKISQRSGLNIGDILFSNIGTIGNIALVSDFYDFSCKNVLIFKPKDKCRAFLYEFLKYPYNKEFFLLQSNGASQKFLSLEYIRNFKTLIPPSELLKKFDSSMIFFYREINNLNSKNQNLKETRDLLLPRLISGKLDIKDLDIV